MSNLVVSTKHYSKLKTMSKVATGYISRFTFQSFQYGK